MPSVPRFTSFERWNLFYTFSFYIAAGLKDFLSYKIFGVPLEFSDCGDEQSTEITSWRGTIEKMLWSFEQIRDDYPDSPFNK